MWRGGEKGATLASGNANEKNRKQDVGEEEEESDEEEEEEEDERHGEEENGEEDEEAEAATCKWAVEDDEDENADTKSRRPMRRTTQQKRKSYTKNKKNRVSLVVQWLRIRLPMQGTEVRALVREDPTCHGATKSACHNY